MSLTEECEKLRVELDQRKEIERLLWSDLAAAESRAQEQDALIGRLTLLAQAYRSMAAGSSVLYASKMGEELSADLDAVLQEAFPCDCETCESARAVSLTSPRPAGERGDP